MIHFSLFSGIGGFDLAADWMGWNNYLSCEINEFGNKILEYYFPKAYHHRDITTLNYETINHELSNRFGYNWRNNDIILTGGFPCQPFSLAGKRKGKNDERYLWGEMLRVISEVKPKFVIAENVFGITNIDGGLVFEQVCLDLEVEGYEVQPFIIPAAAKNAPHRRDRCWFIAFKNTLYSGCIHGRDEQERAEVRQFGDVSTRSEDGIHLSEGDASYSNSLRYRGGDIESRTNKLKEWKVDKNIKQYWDRVWCKVEGCSRNATDTDLSRFKAKGEQSKSTTQSKRAEYSSSRWEQFPTQSPICSGDDGLPTELDGITFSKWRNESIKAYGNAIVPQVAFEIFKSISLI